MRWAVLLILAVAVFAAGVFFGPTIIKELSSQPMPMSETGGRQPDSQVTTAKLPQPSETITITEAPDRGQGKGCRKVLRVTNNTVYRFVASFSWSDNKGYYGGGPGPAMSMQSLAKQSQDIDTGRPCESGWARMEIAQCVLERHTDYECRQLINIQLPLRDPPALSAMNAGWAAMRDKDYPRAVAEFDKAIAEKPGECTFHMARAMARFGNSDWEGVISDSTTALALDDATHSCRPMRATILALRGAAKKRLGDAQSGDRDLEDARRISPAEVDRTLKQLGAEH